ncbi:thiamine pyrophosphokinase-related protein [Microthyrium microscopicum]|uniref:Thiamine pyrophosphokinase-related protein n=1 Tax=Microthyrium microscopicum TaxID=703497 RepID=A0A6A6UI82_9PEZI|nr:thiamine pyrophosphokinase-related protein [Microthyrium microscopicum]
MTKSNLDLVKACDVFPYPPSPAYSAQTSHLVHLRVATDRNTTLGYLLPSIASTFASLPAWELDLDSEPRTLTLLSGSDEPTRSAAMALTTSAMRETGHFAILNNAWRDELYPVYGPDGNELLRVERAASQLFGVVTYGVHMTAYKRDEDGALRVWVPRRAKTKQTFPGWLDNSVAGGLAAGEQPMAALVRECMEEASLSADVASKAKAVGAVTYFYVSGEGSGGEEGLLQPECQLVYDLDLTGMDVELKPNDEEVEGFQLMGMEEVWPALKGGSFKPNCALVLLDFLIRHGEITAESEPNFLEVVARLHRRLEFPLARFPTSSHA